MKAPFAVMIKGEYPKAYMWKSETTLEDAIACAELIKTWEAHKDSIIYIRDRNTKKTVYIAK